MNMYGVNMYGVNIFDVRFYFIWLNVTEPS